MTAASLCSRTVWSTQTIGWLLLLCVFLPLCDGCDGKTRYPTEALKIPSEAKQIGEWARLFTIVQIYGNGVLTAVLLTIAALLKSDKFWWRSFWVQFVVSVLLGLLCIGGSVNEALHWKEAVENGWIHLPPMLSVMVWIGAAIYKNQRTKAWARLQHAWGGAMLVFLFLFCLFASAFRIGFWATLLAIVVQWFVVEMVRGRLEHDLFDRDLTVQPFQYSFRDIFFWSTAIPLVMGYYSFVTKMMEH